MAASSSSSTGVSQALAVKGTALPADPGNETVATRAVDMMKLICGSGIVARNSPCFEGRSKSVGFWSATNLACVSEYPGQ
jgi:hypothetical protein